jgi:hypothetical protein
MVFAHHISYTDVQFASLFLAYKQDGTVSSTLYMYSSDLLESCLHALNTSKKDSDSCNCRLLQDECFSNNFYR